MSRQIGEQKCLYLLKLCWDYILRERILLMHAKLGFFKKYLRNSDIKNIQTLKIVFYKIFVDFSHILLNVC